MDYVELMCFVIKWVVWVDEVWRLVEYVSIVFCKVIFGVFGFVFLEVFIDVFMEFVDLD